MRRGEVMMDPTLQESTQAKYRQNHPEKLVVCAPEIIGQEQ